MRLQQSFEFMYYELLNEKLEVCLIPSLIPEIAADGGCRRAVVQANPQWYRDLCGMYPRDGSTNRKNPRTIVKRQYTLKVLFRLKNGYNSRSKYAPYLRDIAEQLIKDSNITDEQINFFVQYGDLPQPFTDQF